MEHFGGDSLSKELLEVYSGQLQMKGSVADKES